MILQALVSYYEALAKQGKAAKLGWSPVKISYALELNNDGKIVNIIPLKTQDSSGKKMVPQEMILPAPVKRTVGIAANFLCDNSSYILGIDNKGKPERSADCFHAAADLHKQLLEGCDELPAKALVRFFESNHSDELEQLIPQEENRKELFGGGNIVFLYDGQFLHQDPAICQIWQAHYSASDGEKMACLVTGRMDVPAVLHPSIRGVMGAQSSGASLVSFNAQAFCSFGREQGLNAPTSEYAAFAYGAALNYLISSQHTRIGDATVLFWAESAEDQYCSLMECSLDSSLGNYCEEDLHQAVNKLCAGHIVEFDEALLDPNMQFYILGISPNAARLSVRFFLRNSFGAFLRNIQSHQERLEIVHSERDRFKTISLWRLLNETVNQNSREKTPVPNLAGETLRSILNNTPYPSTLLNGVELRIHADHNINRIRAAIIKAYYLKKPNPDIPKEVLQVSLNTECCDTAYVLGRLFSVLENIQNAANPGINTTIRDKYFSSASATPVIVFPTLINLAQWHLRKLNGGLKITFDKQITDLMSKLGESFPTHLTLPQQGSFQLGYYHQTEARYTKKEEN